MENSEKPLRSLNIFLAKPEYRGAENLLRDPHLYVSYGVKIKSGFLGVLFVRPSTPRQPDWLSIFAGYLDESLAALPIVTSSAAAVLIVEHEGRSALITFGFGRSMIAEGVVETRFGLVATLNAIDPEGIRSLDRRSFEQIQRHSREQAAQASGFYAFGLNVEQDLVRAVTGAPLEKVFGERLAGHDSLATTIRCELEDIPDLLDRYIALSGRDEYKERYPWIDNIAEVSDSLLRRKLDTALVRHIQRRELDTVVLCPPEILNWQEVAGFSYRSAKSAMLTSDMDWEAYFSEVRAPREVTAEHLKSDRISVLRTDGNGILDNWSLRNCIAAEIHVGGKRYVLSEGKWYQIDAEFAERVQAAVNSIPETESPLPDYDHDSEEAYNLAAAEASHGVLALMDRKLITTRTASGSIEFCDLYHRERRLLHVKRYGSSSVLSHLFAQGLVSARLMLADVGFREEVNMHLPATHQFTDPTVNPNPRQYEVGYAIVGKPGASLRLPFFSMVNLKNAYDLLTQFGCRVTLTHIVNRKAN